MEKEIYNNCFVKAARKSAPTTRGVKKPHRHRPGTVSLWKLCMREDGKQQVCIVSLQEYKVSNVETIKDLIEKGNATRSTSTTGANEESSRTHTILQLAVKRSVDTTNNDQLLGLVLFVFTLITSGEPKYPKLKLRLSRKTIGIKVVLTQLQCPMSFKVNDRIEMLCQDSGIRGCWIRCKVLRASRKHLKVEYDDVEDADGPDNLEEWIPAFRIAALDKLGMRILGRSTVHPDDSRDFKFEVGAPIDAWCSDGWFTFKFSCQLADGCGSTALLEHKVLTTSKLETVQEVEKQ